MSFTLTDPVAVADIADRCNITTAAVSNYLARHRDTFPAPRFVVARGKVKVWEWSDVEAWLTAPRVRETGPRYVVDVAGSLKARRLL